MYKCDRCHKITKPKEKMNKIITQTRDKTYVNKIGEKEKITYGNEIVKEISLCSNCASKEEKE